MILLVQTTFSFAQYDKNKLTGILTEGSSKKWSVKGVNVQPPEKSVAFNINMSVLVEKDNGKGAVTSQPDKWSITSADNIRWFMTIGKERYELIVSYAKNGTQYIKLIHGEAGGTGSFELNLYPTK